MAILDNLPFRLFIKYGPGNSDYDKLTIFYDDILDLKYQYKPQMRILENQNLEVQLFADNKFPEFIDDDIRLEVDGFDAISLDILQHEDGTYLKAGTGWQIVFTRQDFPLPPGFYVLTVSVRNKHYFTGFEVIPNAIKRMNLWGAMLQEVLENNPEQSVNYAYLHNKAMGYSCNEVTPNMLWKIIVLNKAFTKVTAAMNDIRYNPHNRLIKEYILADKDRRDIADTKSVKYNTLYGLRMNKQIVPQKTISYELQENKYLKKILKELIKLIEECLSEAKSDVHAMQYDLQHPFNNKERKSVEYLRKQRAVNSLYEYCGKIDVLKSAIKKLLNSDWLKDVKETKRGNISGQNFGDPRYNVIYKLYLDLQKISKDYAADVTFTMLWKQTSVLYEYWCFIRIARALTEIGFVLGEEQDFNKVEVKDGVLVIHEINSGDCIIFVNRQNGIKLKVYYDKKIPVIRVPKRKSEDDLSNREYSEILSIAKTKTDKYKEPLYTTSSHNRPDCIIDIYGQSNNLAENDYYYGALIIDFKYRKKSSFWDEYGQFCQSSIDSSQYSNHKHCNVQFMAYKNSIKTIYYENCNGDNLSSIKGGNPVHEVWGVYPDVDNPNKHEFKHLLGIRLLSNVPGSNRQLNLWLDRFFTRFYEDKGFTLS